MPDMTAAEAERLRLDHGYGMFKVVDGAGEGYMAVWAAPWPPPERMLLIIPQHYPTTMVELPDEPMQLEAMREGLTHGWEIYEMTRGRHSEIPDEDAKSMTHVVRLAEYHQGEVFEP